MRQLLLAALLIVSFATSAAAETLTINYTTSKHQVWRGVEFFGRGAYGSTYDSYPDAIQTMWNNLADYGMVQVRFEVDENGENTLGVYDFSDRNTGTGDLDGNGLDTKYTRLMAVVDSATMGRWDRTISVNLLYSGTGAPNGHPHESMSALADYLIACARRFDEKDPTGRIRVNYITPTLEPDHQSPTIDTVAEVAECTLYLRQRLDALGLSRIRLIGPENYQGSTFITYVDTLASTYPSSLAAIDVFSVHQYGGTTQWTNIKNRGVTYGKPVWMTEFTDLTGATLFDDMNSDFSLIQKYGPYTVDNTIANATGNGWFLENRVTQGGDGNVENPLPNFNLAGLRVITQNVWPGSQRLDVSSSPSGRSAHAWRRLDGKLVVVVKQAGKTLAGTVTTASGSPTVTGSSTSFSSALSIGSKLRVDGDSTLYTVQSIESNTSLTLTSNATKTSTSKSGYTNNPFTVANLLPGTYAVKYVDFLGTSSTTYANTITGTEYSGTGFSIRWKRGRSPVADASPSIDYVGAGACVLIQQ